MNKELITKEDEQRIKLKSQMQSLNYHLKGARKSIHNAIELTILLGKQYDTLQEIREEIENLLYEVEKVYKEDKGRN